jgi:ATP-dependent RNA helicase SUPV3L1/SUV3
MTRAAVPLAPLRADAPGVRLTAVLGPTNTGKTHFAMERMLAHGSGMIGFPLRLLARENYDRAVRIKGPHAVALVTGEEKIVPPQARYFLCTVEAMPVEREVEFLAVDEAQLAADPERGHVFTDRLLNARGRLETNIIGAETLRPLLKRILPSAEIVTRPRFSRLAYAGPKKITRLPARTAVIGFSATEVYALAELMRRRRGGTAVVLGALSPRTRNAQVALYQSGDVDYLVATDAIGMGLNLDIDHVAFARLSKFDGRMTRRLTAAELGQIAGRAGRHMNDGTFGTTAGEHMSPEMIEAVEQHRFEPLRTLYWRNPELDFSSLDNLLASLGVPPGNPVFLPAREAEDAATLALLAQVPEVRSRARSREQLKLLWETCQVPDFRKALAEAHSRLIGRLFLDLSGPHGRIRSDWMARQVERVDRAEGDIGTLVGRIAEIRTWTYVSYRTDWVEEARHWQERTRAVEDRLSDALHERLTERFVDKRTAILVRRLAARDELVGGIREDGEVVVEGVPVGRLEAFRFQPIASAQREDARAIRNAAERALRPALAARVSDLEASADTTIVLGESGRVLWVGVPVGVVTRGNSALCPAVRPIAETGIEPELRERIRIRLTAWLMRQIGQRFGVLSHIPGEGVRGPARGLLFQLAEALGCVPTSQVRDLLRALTPADEKLLARAGVRLGTESIYLPRIYNAPALRLAALLWTVHSGRAPDEMPEIPATPRTWFRVDGTWPESFFRALGYRVAGAVAVRADRLEAIAAAARRLARQGQFSATPALASAAGVPLRILPEVLALLGYRFRAGVSGGEFSRRRAPRPNRREPAAETASDSPFAQLRSLSRRPR